MSRVFFKTLNNTIMSKVFEWTIGLILSLIFAAIVGFMLTLFSPKIAQEIKDEESENLFI